MKENGIWHFYENNQKIKNKWIHTEAGYWYYFNQDGNLATGWVQGNDGAWYYCDESTNDDLIGKMLTDTVIRVNGKNYYLDNDGKMVEKGHKLTFIVGENGEMRLDAIK